MQPVFKKYLLDLQVSVRDSPTVSNFLASTIGEHALDLLVLPRASCEQIGKLMCPCIFCTPCQFAHQSGLTPEKKLAAVPPEPLPLHTNAPVNESEKEEVKEEDDDNWMDDERYPVSVILRCIHLMQLL